MTGTRTARNNRFSRLVASFERVGVGLVLMELLLAGVRLTMRSEKN